MSTRACSHCAREFERIRSGVRICSRGTRNGFIYKDELGQLWYGSVCARCHDEKRRVRGHLLRKHKPREKVVDHRFSKAVVAEQKVKAFLERMGFEVQQTTGKGPDLLCQKDGRILSIEVKTAIKMSGKRLRKLYFRTGYFQKNRVQDDLVAIVFANDFILIEPLKERLKKGLMLTDDINELDIFNNPGSSVVRGL